MYEFKTNIKNVDFANQFFLGCISNKFAISNKIWVYLINFETEKVSLKGNVYDFLVNYDAIDKSDILNIRKYLRVKNNIK